MHEIRPLGVQDREEVVDLFLADLKSLRIEHSRDELLVVVDRIVGECSSDNILWGVRADAAGPLDGVLFANVFCSIKHAGRALWLEQLYVRPEARRQGLGKVLVEKLIEWSETQGIRGIDLESYQLNAPASILYRSLGFRRLGRERFCLEFWDEEGDE